MIEKDKVEVGDLWMDYRALNDCAPLPFTVMHIIEVFFSLHPEGFYPVQAHTLWIDDDEIFMFSDEEIDILNHRKITDPAEIAYWLLRFENAREI